MILRAIAAAALVIALIFLIPRRDSIKILCQTTKGSFEVVVQPQWSPLGAERFLMLVDQGYYDGIPLFRCLPGFLCQFGAKPGGQSFKPIPDDPPRPELQTFRPSFVSFAGSGKDSRSTQIFISLSDAKSLGTQPWETPFGYVTQESMRSTVARFYTGYGEQGPQAQKIEAPDGKAYVEKEFPKLDWIETCKRN